MDKNELNDEVEIDLSQLLKLLKKNIGQTAEGRKNLIRKINV